MACDEIVRGIVVFIRWKRGTWKGKGIVKSKEQVETVRKYNIFIL